MPEVPLPARVIHVHPSAPAKPPAGRACNGCGVCCLAEPCPVGVLVTGRWQGACKALQWHSGHGGSAYRCGMVSAPAEVLEWLPTSWAPLVSALSRRWISAGSGCDATLVAERV